MVNSNKLKAKMIEKGYNQKTLANAMGITTQTLNYKINGVREFKVSEIEKLCSLLSINKKETGQFFFV